MDLEKITEAVEKITGDKGLLKKFKKSPVQVVESILGVDLPDEIVEKVIEGVKAKVDLDKVGGIFAGLKKLFKK